MKVSLKLIVITFIVCTYAHANNLPVITHKGAPYVSYNVLVERFNLNSRYDEVAGRLVLFKNKQTAIFIVARQAAIIDGFISRSDNSVTLLNGDILIPLDMANDFIDSFDDRKPVIPKEDPKILPEEKITTPSEKITFIVIDAGHGGKDPGALSKSGVREKDIALSISRLVETELKKHLKDVEVILTRKNDTFIELEKRTDIANSKLKKGSNGIFVSIHLNASLSNKISGIETYYLSQTPTNEEARKTAALENESIKFETNRKKGSYQDIDYIEARMMTTQIQRESVKLANLIQKSLVKGLKDLKDRGVKKADFFVLRGVLMPAVLVEVGYMTNTSDLSKLTKKNYQEAAAKAISDGIIEFLKNYEDLLK